MGISARRIEDLLRVLPPEDRPDHATVGRRVADAAKEAKGVLEALDAACVPEAQALALDETFLGGDRRPSASSRRA
jgi:hypothetical protein